MIIKLKDRTFDFKVDAPASKSVYHRELIVRFLHGLNDNLEYSDGDSDDIKATKDCLKALRDANDHDGDIVLDCRESGSTIRFMITVAVAYLFNKNITNRKLIFKTAGRLFDRPMDALENALSPRGITMTLVAENRTIEVTGTLTEGLFTIDGSISSQFVSGIMMALIVLPNSSIEVTGEKSSIHYIELTQYVIDKYSSSLEGKEVFNVEGDWSGGAFLLCLKELINGKLEVGNLDINSVQGDKAIVDYLNNVGVDELTWDCKDIPDIVPYMAMVAAFRNKKTVFNNTARLRAKESDRVMATREQLEAAGIKTEETDNTLTVYGYDNSFAKDIIDLDSYKDHRMVMSAVLLAAALRVDLQIDDINPLDKSFPAFKDVIREEFS
ncbi:MAG: hypothetical protein MJ094_02985 [Saccharofermentans sp.]|nr:hypothetical protein [Saccharofermentans sp.]